MKPDRPIRFGNAAGLLTVLLTAGGCSYFRTEMGRPFAEKQAAYVSGETTVGTVLRDLGAPNQASRMPQGFAFLYEYSRVSEFQFGFSIDYSIFRYFKLVHAWNNLQQDVLLLTFDDSGVLRSVGDSRRLEDLGGGNALQILVAAVSLSDISHLHRPADAHYWGRRQLERPPVALNSGQSLRTGENGLQQRLAPNHAGQQTLEMPKRKTEKEKRKIKKNYQQPP
jgi:hypothetical protein